MSRSDSKRRGFTAAPAEQVPRLIISTGGDEVGKLHKPLWAKKKAPRQGCLKFVLVPSDPDARYQR